MQLLIATQNQGKKKEIQTILSSKNIECLIPSDISDTTFYFPDETGNTFAENSFIKAQALYQQSGIATLADDSGLSVEALNGFPGVKSARWMEGSDTDRVNGLLDKIAGNSQRQATFTCVLCLFLPNSSPQYFEGTVQGTLAVSPRGTSGFGYDPIFIPEGESKTYGQLSSEYKNQHSHRARALQKLNDFLLKSVVD